MRLTFATRLSLAPLSLIFLAAAAKADEPVAGELVIVDHRGKEVKVKNGKLTQGTRALDWLVPAPTNPKGKADPATPRGPRYLAFRTGHSTTFKEGILTLTPLASVRQLDYDHDKKTVTLTYLGAEDKEGTLTGSTKFIGINRIAIEGETDLGDLGTAAVKFLGGDAKHGIRSVRFPSAQAALPPKGPSAVILAQDKEKTKHPVQELGALYNTADGHRLLPYLMFKKTVKVDLGKIAQLRHVEPDDSKYASFDYEVTLSDGAAHTLTLLEKINTPDGPATLVGLVGRVPAGFELFPMHTIGELIMSKEAKKE